MKTLELARLEIADDILFPPRSSLPPELRHIRGRIAPIGRWDILARSARQVARGQARSVEEGVYNLLEFFLHNYKDIWVLYRAIEHCRDDLAVYTEQVRLTDELRTLVAKQ